MDRQLDSPLLIRPLGHPKKLNSGDTYQSLTRFMLDLPLSPARTQLERLTDALGVENGFIEASEGEAREKKRREEKAAARAERRRLREAEAAAQEEEERENLDAEIEGLGEEADGDVEEGAVQFEGEEGMDDRGDVEYGDVEEDDDDEPDNEPERMEVEEDW